ncbi:Hypothetical protein UVM_LOCUS119 [uncultured virus]|nr:Hypothetical protein UVM_LOCUS119 [uncultured virus]
MDTFADEPLERETFESETGRCLDSIDSRLVALDGVVDGLIDIDKTLSKHLRRGHSIALMKMWNEGEKLWKKGGKPPFDCLSAFLASKRCCLGPDHVAAPKKFLKAFRAFCLQHLLPIPPMPPHVVGSSWTDTVLQKHSISFSVNELGIECLHGVGLRC